MKPKIVQIIWRDPTFYQFGQAKNRPKQAIPYVAYGILQEAGNYYFLDCAFPDEDDAPECKKIGFIIPKGCVEKIIELKKIETKYSWDINNETKTFSMEDYEKNPC
jgi:PHP family Zn ribbon phosphoesterase